jgi:hypothetical protein
MSVVEERIKITNVGLGFELRNKTYGWGSPDVPNFDFVLLTGGAHQAWGPHVSDRTSGALLGWHVRGLCVADRWSPPGMGPTHQ